MNRVAGKTVVVGVGDGAVSADVETNLVTYALGSCVGVTLYDPEARVAGLLHYMLPLSVLDASRAQTRPWMYCDTGFKLLLDTMQSAGARRERIVARAAGGAQVLDSKGVFNIGRKNEQILRQTMAAYRLRLIEEYLGGSVSRTVNIDVATGRVSVRESPIGVIA